ncbi:sulfotransferase [Streptomyces sp. NPDC041003]|uniref:sulfotransferase family protein n=1 Tax=Streptomyces sp. NPDC041003 TaxID=3155730 RepID=UPI0033DA1CCA
MTAIEPTHQPVQTRPGTTRPEPVFILSPPRSFSTVTLALLSGHPQIYGFPEMLVFTNETVGDLVGEKGTEADRFPPEYRRTRLSGVCRAIAQAHEGVQTDEAVARARAWLSSRTEWRAVSVLDHLLHQISPLVGVEKSPDTISSDESLARCLQHYPNARYIHLTRHPVTTQRSMQEQNPRYLTNKRVRAVGAASSWYLGHRRIREALSQLPDDQWIRVRGEDLLGAPESGLRRILEWLDLSATDDVISQMLRTEQWNFAGNGPSGNLYGGDPKFLTDPRLRSIPDPGPVEFDPAWGLIDEMHERMKSLAFELGY